MAEIIKEFLRDAAGLSLFFFVLLSLSFYATSGIYEMNGASRILAASTAIGICFAILCINDTTKKRR